MMIRIINNFKNAIFKTTITALAFLIIACPYMFLLSKFRNHLTFGDSAMLNYAWNIDKKTTECWKDGYPGCGKLIHPVREIFNKPKVYEYATPFLATYPPWHEPSYWYEGLKPHFNLKGQFKVFIKSIRKYIELFVHMQSVLIIAWLLLLFVSSRGWKYIKDLTKEWILLLPAFMALFIYSLANVEFRYLSAFVVLLYLGLFSALKLPDTKEIKKLVSVLVIITSVFMIITSIGSKDLLENRVNGIDGTNQETYKVNLKVARGLKNIGIHEGDKVAVVGIYDEYYWARLARVRITAEVPSEELDNFWAASDSLKLEIFQAFKKAGTKLIVAGRMPISLSSTNIKWKNIEHTPYYFYVL